MYEVILYAAIATIICVMLYSVLGKSVGRGPDNPVDFENMVKDKSPSSNIVLPIIDDKGIPGMAELLKADPTFNLNKFTDAAKSAYSMILEGYADGDKDILSELLNKEVYDTYTAAIDQRDEKEHKQITDLARLKTAEIKHVTLRGKDTQIEVEYHAEIASAIMDKNGDIVQGDPDILSSISEIWTYERKIGSKDPNWRLSDVAPSEGDELAADPSPDTKA